MPMAGFYVLNISPSLGLKPIIAFPKRLPILTFPKGTHPNLPKGKEQVTLPMISANEHQPPLVLPRRGDEGYYVTVKD